MPHVLADTEPVDASEPGLIASHLLNEPFPVVGVSSVTRRVG